jgi:hypothetical protein
MWSFLRRRMQRLTKRGDMSERQCPSLGKEGRRWRKPARGGWNPRRMRHPRHGLRPWHPLLGRGGDFSVVVQKSLTHVAML